MRIDDIQFRIVQKQAELEEKKWWRDHFIARRNEMRKRNAPTGITTRYDLDLVDVIEKINLINIELWDLQDRLLEPV